MCGELADLVHAHFGEQAHGARVQQVHVERLHVVEIGGQLLGAAAHHVHGCRLLLQRVLCTRWLWLLVCRRQRIELHFGSEERAARLLAPPHAAHHNDTRQRVVALLAVVRLLPLMHTHALLTRRRLRLVLQPDDAADVQAECEAYDALDFGRQAREHGHVLLAAARRRAPSAVAHTCVGVRARSTVSRLATRRSTRSFVWHVVVDIIRVML